MKYLILTLLAYGFLFSCKSPQKTVSTSELNQDTNISNDISLTDYKLLSKLTDQVIKRIVNEQMSIEIKQIKYDTDKPVVGKTGKYPIAEETEININRETQLEVIDSIRQGMKSVCAFKSNNNTDINTKIITKTKEKKEAGLKDWQKLLISVGGFFIVGFIVYIMIKIKK